MTTAISSNDPQAIEKLEAKVTALREWQEKAKDFNAYYRTYGTMKGHPDLTDDKAQDIDNELKNRESWQSNQPYPQYLLQNNLQNINRLEKRIQSLKKLEANPIIGFTTAICEVVPDQTNNRLKLIFTEKPAPEICKKLRSHGFLWSPKNQAWQRQLNPNALRAAKSFLREMDQPDNTSYPISNS